MYLDDATVEADRYGGLDEVLVQGGDGRGAGSRARGEGLAGAALPDPHAYLVEAPDVDEFDVRLLRKVRVVLYRRAHDAEVERFQLLPVVQERDRVGVAHGEAEQVEAAGLDGPAQDRRGPVPPPGGGGGEEYPFLNRARGGPGGGPG